jgi:hypothetical protein
MAQTDFKIRPRVLWKNTYKENNSSRYHDLVLNWANWDEFFPNGEISANMAARLEKTIIDLIFHFAHFEDAFLGRSTKAYLLEH